jgi:glycerol-1-phosphatase
MAANEPGAALIAAYDGVVCDLDGVVYRGPDPVPEAPVALQALVTRGVRVVYATNNASRVIADVAGHLAGLGAPATPEAVVSSAEAGAARLARDLTPGARVLALGGEGVVEALARAGLQAVRPADAAHDSITGVAAVLQGFGRDLQVRDFETAARLLRADLPWVATNDDVTLPLPWGLSPGNGAYVDLLVTAVGRRPLVVGKPHPPLYRLALEHLGTDPSRTLAVGDRLDTDILGADAAGLDSAWVMTGVDRPSHLVASAAAPTYVIGSLPELLEPYAAPVRDAGGWRCGRASARFVGEDLVLEPGGATPTESVRAGVAAFLEHRDDSDTRTVDLARIARERLDVLLDGPRSSS